MLLSINFDFLQMSEEAKDRLEFHSHQVENIYTTYRLERNTAISLNSKSQANAHIRNRTFTFI